ncbi:PEP-CTERM sorting domain-containing protein [Massilia sp. Dwa41.01b]|uniref:PEP-CTERM sorting domain-containing protein n=1 Tax=unclassified Massilia TaxID=2609279 RepID=UPI00160266FB|nr:MULTISPECIES: PEP-CTERM sorting domain-containing protein [unclassified Massilia]QNA88854.1 PEP-CTERM sorting domain-containing protein [Massilia sp. Dwa41.01b]QNA99745.1 PEP-CTERM sorting domain-containing protein [Massilia sp. Se16.2.3]
MIKKLIALAATTLFSLDASAGYIQYDLSGNGISGYVVQHDDDHSIAFYQIFIDTERAYARFAAAHGEDNITGATTRFGDGGPTNFAAFDSLSRVYVYNIALDYQSTGSAGVYRFSARYSQREHPEYANDPWAGELVPLALRFSGTARVTAVDPGLVNFIDGEGGYPDGLTRLVPAPVAVPEPAGLGLLGLGLAALAAALRRRSPAR